MKLTNSISISIIIPTLNEAACIGNLLEYIKANSGPKNIKEIIVVDGGSTDGTPTLAKTLGAKTISSEMGRAKQMNKGAELATGHVLYFLPGSVELTTSYVGVETNPCLSLMNYSTNRVALMKTISYTRIPNLLGVFTKYQILQFCHKV